MLRSVMSSQPENRSARDDEGVRAWPVSTAADAALSAYTKPEQPELMS